MVVGLVGSALLLFGGLRATAQCGAPGGEINGCSVLAECDESCDLSLEITPAAAADEVTLLSWTSSDPAVGGVEGSETNPLSGQVQGYEAGQFTVTATWEYAGETYTTEPFTITVTE